MERVGRGEINSHANYTPSLSGYVKGLRRLTDGFVTPGKFWSHGMGLHRVQTDTLREVLSEFEFPRIIEFGSGNSTAFFSSLSNRFEMITFDHDKRYCYSGFDSRIDLQLVNLRQWDEVSFQKVLSMGKYDIAGSEPILKHGFRDERVFYDLSTVALSPPYDLALLDGPNGSGRLLGCVVLASLVAEGSFIMLDDVHHFEFEQVLGQYIEYQVVARLVSKCVHPLFGFSLLRVTKLKYGRTSS